jgi:Membrane bound beta barrel domain (DUF5777)
VIRRSICLMFALAVLAAPVAFAQAPDDAVLNPAEPDTTLIDLPTSLRLPVLKSEIRITHRFVRPLKCDACPNSLLGDAFGIDNGALIGLEYRMGVIPSGQVIVLRARTNKTIQFMGEYGLTRQSAGMPLEIAALASVEGTQNFTGEYSPGVGAVLTRLIGEKAAIHVDPIWVNNTNLGSTNGDDNTFMIGLGARVRFHNTLYLTAEATPRVSGYRPGKTNVAFALEKRLGGHMFQLNFSDTNLATTLAQLAQGTSGAMSPSGKTEWYMGFNITRKFF